MVVSIGVGDLVWFGFLVVGLFFDCVGLPVLICRLTVGFGLV